MSIEFFSCEAPQCESSADCGEGGICVDVADGNCCGPEGGRVCIPAEARCEIGGLGGNATQSTTPGWHH